MPTFQCLNRRDGHSDEAEAEIEARLGSGFNASIGVMVILTGMGVVRTSAYLGCFNASIGVMVILTTWAVTIPTVSALSFNASIGVMVILTQIG